MGISESILIGVLVKNTGKYLDNLMHQIVSQNYHLSKITVVLLESDSNDNSYELCKSVCKKYSNISIVLDKLDFGFDLEHSDLRYSKEKFPYRIKNLIASRNYIVDKYLKNNDYLWWVDSDFECIPSDTINLFIECDKDIVIPILTHDRWGYHDCGSIIFNNDKQIRFQYIKSSDKLVELDRSDTHCFIKSRVFEKLRYKFVEEPYFDGCGGIQDCWSDGTYFSIESKKLGYSLYGAKHIIIKHHNI